MPTSRPDQASGVIVACDQTPDSGERGRTGQAGPGWPAAGRWAAANTVINMTANTIK